MSESTEGLITLLSLIALVGMAFTLLALLITYKGDQDEV